jgi:hypothetical protein
MADQYLSIDYKAWERSLTDLGKRALPKAAADTLTAVAFDAQRSALAEIESDFDRPTSFTLRAFRVEKAKPAAGVDAMYSRLYAAPIQDRYLAFTVFGGTRHRGDKGAGPYDVPVPGPYGRRSAAGGIPRRYAQKLSENKNVFFATLYGVKGYFQRPRRRKGQNVSAPKLLLMFKDEVTAPKTLKLSLAIDRATVGLGSRFASKLASEIRRLRK